MKYKEIYCKREKYKIAENLYKCPICEAEKTIKGFMQHVKNHFFERDISNFKIAAVKKCKEAHINSINDYNEKPNKCLYCGKAILAKDTDKVYKVKEKKFCGKSCSAKFNNMHRDKDVYLKVKETWKIKLQNGEVKEIVKNRNQTKR